ncbi:nucleoside 2-deoxyribosyltransferase [Ligilactobacillus acidipiscis]|jgi:nucleoside deoxyribosyltransferase|uniref:Nucleoside 2-deoxyribosyltransferase n=1 Tax=Ligilactobacillus acidipiscis TaxID=89059 RepID=A0A0R2K5E2_9LACO|nr:nucleoside 2-deoxyribosyltransferase [Ligilactobacillus acidipiscis]KRN81786.1 Nucleoside deoxyribosyltransferase [Ligilactobacillus acidipiscis]MCI1925201.1 nucleoside 2-deoxyribosyltransferase [Ligilactobacillus acidipiscis]MCI1954551.1 nucleoside 2-deoxyribosyltransferase [Ligilactobacillus acidipiscis]WEV58021.1 nucleoside 2-deoxyribosyltransferase [Ligilactobacillus acidipiscis]SFV40487.1 Purine trans deoxyribosylase (Nucleoside deoxyribosyltransferase-I) [Ligilactobacillus acidipiscis
MTIAKEKNVEFDPEVSPVKAYIGCAWFSEEQDKLRQAGLKAIAKNPSVSRKFSHYPLDFQYKDLNVTEHPELMDDIEWQVQTFRADIAGIKGSDIGIMLFNPSDIDDGIAYECGVLATMNKPIVLVIPDDDEKPLNLMIAHGVTRVIKLSELADFDFRHITLGTYIGKVF